MNQSAFSKDSVEVKYILPDGIKGTTKFKIKLTDHSGVEIKDFTPEYAVRVSNRFTTIQNNEFSIPEDRKIFYIKLFFKRTDISKDRLILELIPTNNKEWFLHDSFKSDITFREVFHITNFIKPESLVVNENETTELECLFSRPLDLELNLNIKLSYITANRDNIDHLLVDIDNKGLKAIGNNRNIVLPKGIDRFKIGLFIKDDRLNIEDKKFEIVFRELDIPTNTDINQNNKITITIRDKTSLPKDTLINTFCIGLDQWGVYSNGSHGTYNKLIKINSTECGFTYPSVGTVINSFCVGTTRVNHVADGNGGYTKDIINYHHHECLDSYGKNPIDTEVTPTHLVKVENNSVILDPDNVIFNAHLYDQAYSYFKTRYGKWYFEIEVYDPIEIHQFIRLGFATDTANLELPIGRDRKSWSWNIESSKRIHDNNQTSFITVFPVKDRDVVSVLLDMDLLQFKVWVNGRDLGIVYNNLEDTLLRFVIGNNIDSWCYVNFGKYAFKYTPPDGYYKGFGEIPDPPPAEGTVINTSCRDTTLIKKIANGKGGFTLQEIPDHVDCGWIDPNAPKGTLIKYFCKGFDRWKKLTDGNGGYYEEFDDLNHVDCGYVLPSLGELTPTIWDRENANINTQFNSDYSVILAGKVYTVHKTNFGIWYIEFTEWDNLCYLGIYNDNTQYDNLSFNGFIGFDPITGNIHDSDGSRQITTPVDNNSIIGISLDFLRQESVIYINGEKVGILKTNLSDADHYGFSVMTKNSGDRSHIAANFGNLPLQYPPINHIPGFGATFTIYPKRGIILKEFCKDWELWKIVADGAGGTYRELVEINNADCGWYPDPEIGTVLKTYCKGFHKYQLIAKGNYTTEEVLFKENDRECGFIPYGELLSWYCEGYTKMGKYSDGLGGFYTGVEQYNSKDCGSPIDPVDTVLREFCVGYNRVQHKADGNGGYYVHVKEYNSTECGYIPPNTNTQDILIPTKWETPNSNSSIVLSNDDRDVHGRGRDGVKTIFKPIYGKWYFELKILIPTEHNRVSAIGVSKDGYNINNWLGSDIYSWGWWPHDGTKFHNDTQRFYNKDLRLQNNDIVSVLLDLQESMKIEFMVNGEHKGVLYDQLPEYTPINFVFNAINDSYLSANFGQNVFEYEVPEGYYPGFGELKNPPPKRNTLLETFCKDVDQWGRYADGKFGNYEELIKSNSTECGWVPPIPPKGTFLRSKCDGIQLYHVFADGNNGEYETLIEEKSTECGYNPPLDEIVDYGYFMDPNGGNQFIFPPDPFTIDPNDPTKANVKKFILSKLGLYSGLHYFEIEVKDLNTIVGFLQDQIYSGNLEFQTVSERSVYPITDPILPHRSVPSYLDWYLKRKKIAWAIGHKKIYDNGVESDFDVDITIGDIIGFKLDFVNQKISIRINNGEWLDFFNQLHSVHYLYNDFIDQYTVLHEMSKHYLHYGYFILLGRYDETLDTNVSVHFREDQLVYEAPTGFSKGWGKVRSLKYERYNYNYKRNEKCIENFVETLQVPDGNGDYIDISIIKSKKCGWKPPDPRGTPLGQICEGLNLMNKLADGNYGYYTELAEENSITCGYKPHGTLLSTRCDGFNEIGIYSDGVYVNGNPGTYEQLIKNNSSNCGYKNPIQDNNEISIDPNLPLSHDKGLLFHLRKEDSEELIFKYPL